MSGVERNPSVGLDFQFNFGHFRPAVRTQDVRACPPTRAPVPVGANAAKRGRCSHKILIEVGLGAQPVLARAVVAITNVYVATYAHTLRYGAGFVVRHNVAVTLLLVSVGLEVPPNE